MKLIKSYGFSVIELSVVLAIVGIISVGALLSYSEQRTNVLWKEADARLDLVKSSLLSYVKTNKHMPCPDSSGDGFENRTSNACSSNTGGVPFKDLQLSLADVADSYGNQLIYAVNQDSTNTSNINDCPLDSACYFNNSAPPQFDLTTRPVPGSPGNNNLKVCNTTTCIGTTTGADIVGDDLIAVLIATNENGTNTANASPAEAENQNNDRFFSQLAYSTSPLFDDRIFTISANELKERLESEIIVLPDPCEDCDQTDPNNPFANASVPIAGGSGDNNRFAPEIGVNIESGTMDFGVDNAGKMVTITFDMRVTGGWEDANAARGDNDAETNSSGQLETQDQFVVAFNSNVDQELYDHSNDGTLVDLDEGLNQLLGESGKTKEELQGDEQYADQFFFYDANDDSNNEWFETNSYNVMLDDQGQLKIDFANFSTQETEFVEVNNVNGTLYNAPQSIPTLPDKDTVQQIFDDTSS